MDEQKGLIVQYLEKLFGRNWRTSGSTWLAVLCGASGLILDTLSQVGVSAKILKFVALFFVLIAGLNAKDKAVSGLNVTYATGNPGKKEPDPVAIIAANPDPEKVVNQK